MDKAQYLLITNKRESKNTESKIKGCSQLKWSWLTEIQPIDLTMGGKYLYVVSTLIENSHSALCFT